MDRRNALVTGALGISALSAMSSLLAAEPEASPDTELDSMAAVLKRHDAAFNSHDLPGVMACLTDKAMIMGTGPEEVWAGPDEIKFAYENFFTGFDKGSHDYDGKFRVGGKAAEGGWLLTSGTVTGTKDGKAFSYPMNISLTVVKVGDDWKIAGLHYSTLTNHAAARE